jgi:hypothetical protein
MKKVLLIVALFGFGIWGCSENANLTGPEKSETQQSFMKVATNNSTMLMKTSVSKVIDGDRGGIVWINLQSEDKEFGAFGALWFKRGSFDGKENISVSLADGIAALDFEPSGIPLDKAAILTATIKGLDLNDGDDIDFKYIDENGNLASVDYRRLIVNKRRGWVTVIGAKLEHFSRYGWTR